MMKLRAHHILCYHGFSGRGYDEKFIENMKTKKKLFLSNPEMEIEIVAGPDAICDACPHLGADGCFKEKDKSAELKTKELDKSVLRISSIGENSVMEVRKAFEMVERTFNPEILKEICRDCEWISLGHCAERISKKFFE